MPDWIRRWQVKSVTEPVLTPEQRPEQTLVSKWFQPTAEPVRTVARPNEYAAFFFDPNPIPVQAYDPAGLEWFRLAPEKLDRPLRPTEFPALFFDAAPRRTVTVDDWFVRAPDRVDARPPLVELPFFAYDPQPFGSVTPDMWWRQAEEPPVRFRAAPERYPYLAFDFEPVPAPAVAAAVTGTILTAVEADIVSGGSTIVVTLTNGTWVADDGTFAAQRQNILDGLDSDGIEATGWNAEVRDKQDVSGVVRTSDTVVTITLSAAGDYAIDADETITVTVPADAISGASDVTGSPTFTITAQAAEQPLPAEQPGAGGGGGKSPHWWPAIGRADYDERERIAAQLRDLYEGVYEAVRDPVTDAAEDIADEAAAVVAEYAPVSADDLPQPSQVDWQAFIDDGRTAVLKAVTRLREMEQRIDRLGLRHRDDEDDDEMATLLLMN